MRRLNVTEGLLFVVLWGGNELSEGGEREQDEGRGGDEEEEEGDSGNSALAEARASGRPAQSACTRGPPLPNEQHDNQTNAAQETASTEEIKQLWHKIKQSNQVIHRQHTKQARLDYSYVTDEVVLKFNSLQEVSRFSIFGEKNTSYLMTENLVNVFMPLFCLC